MNLLPQQANEILVYPTHPRFVDLHVKKKGATVHGAAITDRLVSGDYHP
jgi:hypothetical protein